MPTEFFNLGMATSWGKEKLNSNQCLKNDLVSHPTHGLVWLLSSKAYQLSWWRGWVNIWSAKADVNESISPRKYYFKENLTLIYIGISCKDMQICMWTLHWRLAVAHATGFSSPQYQCCPDMIDFNSMSNCLGLFYG